MLDAPVQRALAKTIRIMVVPNITYAKNLEKDSYIQFLATTIKALNARRSDLFWDVLLPKPVPGITDLPNVFYVNYPVRTFAPTMRVHFDTKRFQELAGRFTDIDLLWSHLPEHTHQIHTTLANLTHHRPRYFGYSHWFDLPEVCTWEGGSFIENMSGILAMDWCYCNTQTQRGAVLDYAKTIFAPDVVTTLATKLRVLPPGVLDEDIVDAPNLKTEKIIVFNHRPEPYKDWPNMVRVFDRLWEHRQDFVVWVPLYGKSHSYPWLDATPMNKANYYAKLRTCRVGIGPRQKYEGWSVACTDGMMNGCPYILFDSLSYSELDPYGLSKYHTQEELLWHLNLYLDNEDFRNKEAERTLRHTRQALRHDLRMGVLSTDIDTLMAMLPRRHTDAYHRLVNLVQASGRMTKRELMTSHLNWGRSLPFTPYRRALLDHPNIFDEMGPDPAYVWKD